MIVMFSVAEYSPRLGGGIKDTLRNIQDNGEMVINLVDYSLAAAMNQTAGEYAYGINEFDAAALCTADSVDVKPPRVCDARVAMEARAHQIIPVEDTTNTMVLARIVRYHVRADLLRGDGSVDPALLEPVARLGGTEYAELGRVFAMTRPQVNR